MSMYLHYVSYGATFVFNIFSNIDSAAIDRKRSTYVVETVMSMLLNNSYYTTDFK